MKIIILLLSLILFGCESSTNSTTDTVSGSGDVSVQEVSSITVTFDADGKPVINKSDVVKPTVVKPVVKKPNKKGGTVTPQPTPSPTPTPVKVEPTGKSLGTFTSYGTRNGGRQAWRIPRKGPSFGSKIKVVFSDGHTVYVNNTSKNYRESDGFVFKPGIGPNGEGQADTGTSHGGVYLHAPYGNRSKQVTFFSY